MNLDSKYFDEFYNYVAEGIKPNSKSKKAVHSSTSMERFKMRLYTLG